MYKRSLKSYNVHTMAKLQVDANLIIIFNNTLIVPTLVYECSVYYGFLKHRLGKPRKICCKIIKCKESDYIRSVESIYMESVLKFASNVIKDLMFSCYTQHFELPCTCTQTILSNACARNFTLCDNKISYIFIFIYLLDQVY